MTWVAQDVIPEGVLASRRGAGGGSGLARVSGGVLVRVSGGIVAALGGLGVDAPALVVGGQARAGRGPVVGVMLRETGRRDVRQEAAGRVVRGGPVVMGRPGALGSPLALSGPVVMGGPRALGGPAVMGCPGALGSPGALGGPVVMRRPVALSSPVVAGSRVVMGAGRGSGALNAAQAEAGRQTGRPETGLPGRGKPGTATAPGRTVVPEQGAGRGPGHSGAEMVAGKAAAALECVHLLRGAAAMAAPAARALRCCPVAGLGPGPGETPVAGATPAPGATIGMHGGHPAGSVWRSLTGSVLIS